MSTIWLDQDQFNQLSEAAFTDDQNHGRLNLDGEFRRVATQIAMEAGVEINSDFHPNLWLTFKGIDGAQGRFALTTALHEEP